MPFNGMTVALNTQTDLLLKNPATRRLEYDYPTEPVLFRAWRDPDGTYRRDTLITYPDSDISSTPEVMSKVLNDIRELFPAPHYGLVISSHGKGWIPTGYSENNSSILLEAAAFASRFLLTRRSPQSHPPPSSC